MNVPAEPKKKFCNTCDYPVEEDGKCNEWDGPCQWCPEECPECGRGFCDQSC